MNYFIGWFHSLGIKMYNVKLWSIDGKYKSYIGSQYFFNRKRAEAFKESWIDGKEFDATIITEIVYLF